jgi:hypothetical protein
MLITASIYDPVKSEEGTIDPLGLGAISERLASRLLPGIRQRMTRPRFLTAIAAGAHVCHHFYDRVAKDGKTEPFLVFEWYVVQALFKVYNADGSQLMGMPGRMKAKDAWLKGDPLSMNRYLKNAYTFGYNGVYRTLAEELDISSPEALGEQGDRLLRIWEEEQDLPGFISSQPGKGKQLFEKLRSAVETGLEKGEVAYPWSWKGFDEIAPLFAPYKGGVREKQLIYELLLDDETGYRRELLTSIPSFLEKFQEEEVLTDRMFHEFLMERNGSYLKDLLETIKTYEKFGRVLYNTFYLMLEYLADKNRKVPLKELIAQVPGIKDISSFRALFHEAGNRLLNYKESTHFETLFQSFEGLLKPEDFIPSLIRHHQKIQEEKPPSGKMPWLEEFPDGSYMIRPAYRDQPHYISDVEYVNQYRLDSLLNFNHDLTQ